MSLGQRWRVLAGVLVNSGFHVLVPELAVAARDLQVNADLIGIMFPASAVVSLVLQLPVGIASDRYGRRGCILGGALTTAAALVIRARSNDALAFGASALLYGVLAQVLAMPDTPFPGRTQATTAILSSTLRFLGGADGVALSLLVTALPAC